MFLNRISTNVDVRYCSYTSCFSFLRLPPRFHTRQPSRDDGDWIFAPKMDVLNPQNIFKGRADSHGGITINE